MQSHLMLKRIAGSAAVLVASAMMPQALQAACINQYNPISGVQTITCCGEVKCCTTTWHGSELQSLVCFP
jgi:hypothetical protein